MLWPIIKQRKTTQILQTQGRAGINGNPLFNWFAYERDIPSDSTSSRPSSLPAPKLTYFSKLYDALKTHMHFKHKLGHANPTNYFSYYKGYFL